MESSEKKLPTYSIWDSARHVYIHTLPVGTEGVKVKIIEHYAWTEGRWTRTGELSLCSTGQP